MKNILACLLMMGSVLVNAEPDITDVTARQRYPWNGKVDVAVTIEGVTADDLAEVVCAFAATNSATGAAIPVTSITRRGTDTGSGTTWTRRFVWDAAQDAGAVKIDDVALTVDVKQKLDGVQLWENGPYWAECNVGATKPEEYGYYFWWGDTVGYKRKGGTWMSGYYYSGVTWVSSTGTRMTISPFAEGNCPTYGKDNSQLQSAGYIDSTGNLVAAHDAATAHLGAPWRMPTDAEFGALLSNCDTTWTTRGGVSGRLVTGRGAYAAKSIFLPAAGDGYGSSLYLAGSLGYYWFSAPNSGYSGYACFLYFDSGYFSWYDYGYRYYGRSVRPVRGFAKQDAWVVSAGVTTHLTLDCQTGTRTAAETETITCSTEWTEGAGDSATALVAVDGEVVSEQSGSGTVAWTPKYDGTYEFTHTVKTNGMAVGEVLVATFIVEGVSPKKPVVSPNSGTTFDTSLTVSMTCASDGATIRYTTDGSEPTMASTKYTKKFRIYGKTTIKAIAFYEDGTPSEMAVAKYAKGQCDDPMIVPSDGTEFDHSGQVVTIAWAGNDGVLRYTTDGSDPTEESPEYTESFTVDSDVVVKAKAFGDQYFDSGITTARLTRVWVKLATPVIAAESAFTGTKNKVVISCANEGATIYYTLDGSEPTAESPVYEKPFCVGESCTVRAKAVQYDYLDSDVAEKSIMREWSIGETMGKPDHTFETGGDKGFVRVTDATAALGEAMQSGEIKNSQTSILSTVVVGPGTLKFKWKTSCEEDEELHEWDRAEFAVDGDIKGILDGETEWIAVEQRIEGNDAHTVTWKYIKDDTEFEGEDCLWVSEYVWASDLTETQTTDVPVPYGWLEAKCTDVVNEFDSYEKAAHGTALNGRLTVEQCYVAGVDPESATNDFTTVIEMRDGVPVVTWEPDLGAARAYKIWGSENLHDWQWPTNALHRFFKVTVEME